MQVPRALSRMPLPHSSPVSPGRPASVVGHCRGALTALLLTLATGPVAAEDFFEFSPEALARLRVTAASAFTESSLDASASVSVVRREEWERRGSRTGPDAVLHLPGVMLLYPPAGGPLIQVRSYDSTSLRGRATVLDGVPINTFAFGSEVFSNAELRLPVLDSLELVRGPSSILYGSDAFHSALVLSSYNDPVPSFSISGTAGLRQYRQMAARGTATPADGQTVQVAVAVAHQGDQHVRFDYQPLGGGHATASRDHRYDAATAMTRWSGRHDQLGYSVQLLVDKTDADEFPGGGTFAGDVRQHDMADRNGELWLLKGALEGSLPGAWRWEVDAYGWRNDYGQSYILPANAAAENFFEDRQQFIEYRYGTRGELKRDNLRWGTATTQLAITAGIERAEIDEHENERNPLSNFVPTAAMVDYRGLHQSIRSLAFEAKTRWRDSPWQLLYGGRLDDYSTFGYEWSPRLGVIWMPVGHYSVRVVYGTAFRAPNANELRGTNFVSGDPLLDPETMESVEVAFTWARGGWQWGVVGFANRWEDRILLKQDPASPVGLRYTNIGESEARGVEGSLNWRSDRWRVELSGAWLHNENQETGWEPTLFPDWTASIGVGYRWPDKRLELFLANRIHENVLAGDSTLGSMQLDSAGTFFRSDLSLTQDWGSHWQGRVIVRNLFDRNNVWPSITNSVGGIDDIDRQFVLEVSWRGLR